MNNSNVKVAVRVRPLNQKEEGLSSECVVRVSGNQITLLPPISYKEKARNDPHNFTFDNCFWTEDRHDTGQEDVFRHLGDGALENIWHGYNVCIFAYGQTGSGKTFSMMGTDDQPGIVPRICLALFGKESNDSETIRIEASYFEIYNEEVRDLLRSTKKQKKLRVREDRVLGPYVEGLSCHAVQNYGKIKLLLDQGNNQRAIAETKMNEQSSRSHAILTLNVTQTCNDHKSGASRELMSKVSLVDLAGSERSYKSGAQGRQLKESCNINKSLLTLGLVINSLAKISENKKRGQYVNYRDSVLTWLLKNSLGGNSKTIMLATVSPAADNYQETLSTLKYADSAKQIVNQAVVNEDRKSEVIEELQEEIKRLRVQLTKTEQLKQAELQEQLEEKENLLRDLKTSWEEKLKRTEAATQEWRKNLENMGVIPNKQDVIFSNQCYLIQQGTTLIVHNITDHTKIGSGLSQDIQISGAEQEHCVIRRTEDEVFLIPINNSKTYINGCLFKTLTQLWHEDKIQIGNNVFILHLPNRPKPDHMKTKVSTEAEAQTCNELNTENDTLFIPFNRGAWNSSMDEDEKSKLDKKAKGFTQTIQATDEFFSFPKNKKMSDMFTQLSSESNSCLNNMNVNTIRNTPAEYLEVGVGRQIQDSMVQCSPQYGEASSQTFEGLKSRDYFQDTPEMEYHATLPRQDIKMEAPVCLIENLKDGSLQVNAEAVEILSKINQPLVVVAINGMYRTGKSYLMNKLAGVLKGFELSAAVQAKTKGIWMWCVPHPLMKEKTLVLLDTEGLGDVQKRNSKNDLKIFCLSVLLSSALIYNSRGTIDEDAVEKLRFVGELAELIKVKSKDNENNEGQFSRHFPAFIWAVRDVTLMLELDGKEITEDEYLENALSPQKLESTEETSKISNRCRDTIRMYFNTRKCFVFDPPSADKKVLQRMDEVSEEELSSSFVDQCHKFCEYIYKNVEVKLLDDIKPVSGEILGQLVYKYTEAINSSTAVCMEDTVMSISEMENKAAVQEATEHYEKRMRERGQFPTETLEEFIELSAQCEEEALQIFIGKSFNDLKLIFHAQFMGNIEKRKREFSEMNEVKSRKYCNRLIKKHSRDHEKALQQGLYSKPGGYLKFQEDMALIEERYNSEPRKGVERIPGCLNPCQSSSSRLPSMLILKPGEERRLEESRFWEALGILRPLLLSYSGVREAVEVFFFPGSRS
ncbi:uncharacterized protein [Aquarana catesbeiana]|uniref:uncharacterized protein isoform X2 n=1 Tax=Aquarana catesbeiana TaxID=8400 RepID=UPI003CC99C05